MKQRFRLRWLLYPFRNVWNGISGVLFPHRTNWRLELHNQAMLETDLPVFGVVDNSTGRLGSSGGGRRKGRNGPTRIDSISLRYELADGSLLNVTSCRPAPDEHRAIQIDHYVKRFFMLLAARDPAVSEPQDRRDAYERRMEDAVREMRAAIESGVLAWEQTDIVIDGEVITFSTLSVDGEWFARALLPDVDVILDANRVPDNSVTLHRIVDLAPYLQSH